MNNSVETLKAQIERLVEENRSLETKLFEIHTLYNVSKALSIPFKLDDIFEVAMYLMQSSLQVDDYCLLLHDAETDSLSLSAALGFEDAHRSIGPFSVRGGTL